MSNTIISIIVPCYNQGKYLDDALSSVLSQTYSNWECIIVNDGSTDNTKEIANKWTKKDCRFILFNKLNEGLPKARNFGILKANGDYILPLDADDKINNDYLRLSIESFNNDSNLKVVYCNAEKFGEEKGRWNLPTFSLFNLSRNNIIFTSAMYKKADCLNIGGYDFEMIYGWEDWEFWISMLKGGGKVKQLSYVGFFYRIKSDSMLKNINIEKGKYLLEYMSVKHADFFVKYYGSFVSLDREIKKVHDSYKYKLKSEKFVIDVFCKKFFGFSVFHKY